MSEYESSEPTELPTEMPPVAALKKSAMAREIKVGVAIIGSLLVVFGYALYQRLAPNKPLPADAVDLTDADLTAGESPPFSAGPERPTVVAASAASDALTTAHPVPRRYEALPDSDGPPLAQPRRSLMPTFTDDAPKADPFAARAASDGAEDQQDESAFGTDNADLDAQQTAFNPPASPEASATESEPAEVNAVSSDEPRILAVTENDTDDGNPLRPANAYDAQPTAGSEGETEPRYSAPVAPPSDSQFPAARTNNPFSVRATPSITAPQETLPTQPAELPPSYSPATRNGERYTVQPNDTYWSISEKLYGTGAYFKALYVHNRPSHPRADKLQVGQTINAPDASVLHDKYADVCPKPRHVAAAQRQQTTLASSRMHSGGRVYIVEEGDTLFDIARYELGKPARWGEIYDLNRELLGEDFDYLRPGTELILPTDERPDPVTRRPTGVLER